MKETILFIALLRNNECYLNYMNTIFKDIEKNNPESKFDYFFYTNDNEDNTIGTLEKYNYKYFDDKDIQYKNERIKKLAYLRQKLLESIKETKSNYIILFDSDVLFNNTMITEAIKTVKQRKLKVTCLNTIKYPLPLFYDWMAHKNYNTKECLKLSLKTLFSNDIIETDTFFNGIMIFENDDSFKNYNYKFDKDDIFICEHNLLNKSIEKEGNKINIISNITPVYSENFPPKKEGSYDDEHYKYFYNLIENKGSDIRNNLLMCYFILFILIIVSIVIIFKKLFYW